MASTETKSFQEFIENPARPNQRDNFAITNFVSNYDDLGRQSIEEIIKSAETHNFDYLEKTESGGILKKIAHYLKLANPLEWIFLFFFAVCCTIILLMIDFIISFAVDLRTMLCSSTFSSFNFIFWVVSCLLLMLAATSVGYFISADADGSGIPEVKTVLSGINIYRYFSLEAFIGKVIGLFSAVTAGASTGKVGPYLHLSTIICNRLLKLKLFSKISKSTSIRNNMIASAAALGITFALGSPLGGVVFSIEVIHTIYIVSNIWKAFFCAVMCIFISNLLKSNENIQLFNIDAIQDIGSFRSEFIFFFIQGIIGGIIGAMLSTIVAKIVYIRRKSTLTILNNRFQFAILVGLIVSLLTYIIKPLSIPDRNMLSLLFSQKINDNTKLQDIVHSSEGLYLLVLFSFKFILTVLSLCVNMPCGIFEPFFLIGAYYGRLYGHFVKSLFGVSEESIFAMVGASCVMSGATHTISSSIIIFELTGQASHLAPLLFASLIANLTAQSLAMSIFDVLLTIKNLPDLSSIKSLKMYHMSVFDIMSKVKYSFNLIHFSHLNALIILGKVTRKFSYTIPIVDDSNKIRFTVNPKNLYKYLKTAYGEVRSTIDQNLQGKLDEYFRLVHKRLYKKHNSLLILLKNKCSKLYNGKIKREMLKKQKDFEKESLMRLLQLFFDGIYIFY